MFAGCLLLIHQSGDTSSGQVVDPEFHRAGCWQAPVEGRVRPDRIRRVPEANRLEEHGVSDSRRPVGVDRRQRAVIVPRRAE